MSGPVPKVRLLQVEDNPGDAEIVREYLEQATQPLGVIHVETVEAALATIAAAPLDGVLLDLGLPDASGIDAIERLRALRPELPLIVLSGGSDPELRQRALGAGALDVIHKSESGSRFFASAVLYLLQRHKAERQQLQLAQLVSSNPDAVLVVSERGEVRYVNPAALQLFGVAEADLVGELIDFSVPPETETELMLHPVGGPSRVGLVRAVPIEWYGEGARMVSIRDITLRKQAELLRARSEALEIESRVKGEFVAALEVANAQLARQNEELLRAKEHAEILLREIHHRVKNNLQVVSSLIQLQADAVSDPDTVRVLERTAGRVTSIARAHEHLYQIHHPGQVDLAVYLGAIAEHALAASAQERALALSLRLASVTLPLDLAIPCGLIINELVSNAVQHAFGGRTTGNVWVVLATPAPGWLALEVTDDGTGCASPDEDARGFGFELVAVFAAQLDGTYEVVGDVGLGTSVRVRFPVRRRAGAVPAP